MIRRATPAQEDDELKAHESGRPDARHLPGGYRKNEFLANRVVDAWAEIYERSEELEAQGFSLADVTPQVVAAAVQKEMRGLYKLMVGKAKAEASAHPSLTAQPLVRDTDKKDEPPKKRLTQAQLIRRAYGRNTQGT